MGTLIGDLVYRKRMEGRLTQDQYGQRFGVSGPAVFKFEKGYVNPSFKLWMRMAKDIGLEEGDAVVLFAKCKVPEEMQDHITRQGTRADVVKKLGLASESFHRFTDHEKLRDVILKDENVPRGLRVLAKDKTLWEIFRPTGREIDRLLLAFGPYGDGTKHRWLEALRVIKMFAD